MCVCVLVVVVAVFEFVIVHLYLYLHLPGLPCPYPLGPSTAWSALSCITAAHKWSSTPVIIPLTAWLTLYLYLYLRFCIYIWHHHRPQVIIHSCDHLQAIILTSPSNSCQALATRATWACLVLRMWGGSFKHGFDNCVCDVMQGQQQKKLNLRLLRLLNLFSIASQFYFYQTATNFAKCRSCGFAQSAQTLRFASCPESCCPTHISKCGMAT